MHHIALVTCRSSLSYRRQASNSAGIQGSVDRTSGRVPPQRPHRSARLPKPVCASQHRSGLVGRRQFTPEPDTQRQSPPGRFHRSIDWQPPRWRTPEHNQRRQGGIGVDVDPDGFHRITCASWLPCVGASVPLPASNAISTASFAPTPIGKAARTESYYLWLPRLS